MPVNWERKQAKDFINTLVINKCIRLNKDTDKIFVTGGAGLVGKELLSQLLSDGYHVRALFHSSQIELDHPNLEKVQGDILDVVLLEEALEGITHVFHCAALVSYDPADRYQLFKLNTTGTANIVNACIDGGIRKLVYVSSVAAIGRNRNEVVNEQMTWSEKTNNSTYGKSKYLAEMEVWRGIGEGLDAVIVNPSLILGGTDWSSGSSAIFKSAYDEFPWYSEGMSGFVDVRDVARAMILLMNSNISGQRFILSGENVSFRQIFSSIAKCFGKKPPHKKVTPLLAEFVWRLEALKASFSGKKPLLTRETARTSLAHIRFDTSKILKALPGFHFTPIEETIRFTCNNLKEKYTLS